MNAKTDGGTDAALAKDDAAKQGGVNQRESLDAHQALLSVLAKWARATKHEGQTSSMPFTVVARSNMDRLLTPSTC